MPKKHPQEVNDFLYANYKGIGSRELTEKLNERFGTSYTMQQVKSWKEIRHLKSGVDGGFKKGHIPHNKGKKIEQAPGSIEHRFRKDKRPYAYKPIGSERNGAGGYVYVKVRELQPGEPNGANFKLKQRVIWEAEHGPLKPNECVIFKDGNKKNFDLKNLAAVTRREHATMISHDLRSADPDLTATGVAAARLIIAIADRKGKQNGI